MREKPRGVLEIDWQAFCEWADKNNVGEATDDWQPWFDCWWAGLGYGAMQ